MHLAAPSGLLDLRARTLDFLILLVVVVVLVNVRSAWALTVTPSSPIAGQSFTITSSNSGSDIITVRTGSGCSNQASIVGGGGVGPLGSLSLTLSAGQYSASGITTPNGCVNFTVIPASITLNAMATITTAATTFSQPAVHPLNVGGEMLPVNIPQVLAPWLVVMLASTVVAVETLVVRRKRSRHNGKA